MPGPLSPFDDWCGSFNSCAYILAPYILIILLMYLPRFTFISLNLQENRFSGTLHSEFGNLLSLERLQLSSNEFTGTIPSEMSSLSTLVGLNITGNRYVMRFY
jgi:hypothetical protein